MIERAKSAYKTWLVVHKKMSRTERFGIGNRLDDLWLDLLDALRKAAYAQGNEKVAALNATIRCIDAVRFFTQLAWESGLMAQSHFIELGKSVEEIGRMVGGWKKGLLSRNPPR